ncbi:MULTISPECIES: rhomboid family intramembrane serine protease [unclassified Sphingomonas]|jgi:membrane associated rhomboid family serine protease|uniref:rhomboid family intramembrane serine protease n=1 Tax=unclassified Sphingomonas TaxID=196159 RepID=UPI000AB8E741|nr:MULTISPECIES: rhomboid family intramembrane serine protease [unclassified Sphingomonas]
MAVMTWVIVAVTCAVSLALTFSGNENLAIAAGGVIPARVSGLIVMPPYLAVVPAWLTPLSATLVHGGPVHLGFNMLMLAQTGRLVERLLGPARVALIYLLGAYAAAAAQWALDPASMSPMVGASGAVSAVLGSYAMFFSRRKARAIGPIPGRVVDIAWIAGGWIVLNIVVALVSTAAGFPIAGAAHIGGFLLGMILAFPLLPRRHRPS